MPIPFPEFTEPTPLTDGGSWTAEYESYDPRTDSAYYCVSLCVPKATALAEAAEGETGLELWARVHCSGVPEPEFLFKQVRDVAESGTSNTEYRGSRWSGRLQRRRSREPQEDPWEPPDVW